MTSLQRLAELARAQGGLLAAVVRDDSLLAGNGAPEQGPAQIASAGPRAEGNRERYELLMEAIYEGYLLHYSQPRVVDGVPDDLCLLAGDRLYALGLSLLVELGDIDAVSELADLITISARAQEADDLDMAEAAWLAGARSIGWGQSASHRIAKELAFANAPDALAAMRVSTRA
jgi:hypothetical protein